MVHQVRIRIAAREVHASPEQLRIVTIGAAIVEDGLNLAAEADAAVVVTMLAVAVLPADVLPLPLISIVVANVLLARSNLAVSTCSRVGTGSLQHQDGGDDAQQSYQKFAIACH
jgi:hypothetical protein